MSHLALWPCGRPMGKYRGIYPLGFLRRLYALYSHDRVLHMFGGTTKDGGVSVDVNPDTRPSVVADALCLPFRADTFDLVLADPPYSDKWASSLYGTKNPTTTKILREAIRVCEPGGHVALLHLFPPQTPKGGRRVATIGVTAGPLHRIRVLTVFQKDHEQAELAV